MIDLLKFRINKKFLCILFFVKVYFFVFLTKIGMINQKVFFDRESSHILCSDYTSVEVFIISKDIKSCIGSIVLAQFSKDFFKHRNYEFFFSIELKENVNKNIFYRDLEVFLKKNKYFMDYLKKSVDNKNDLFEDIKKER